MNEKVWFASIATLGAVDVYAAYVKRDGTLSQASRELFRTNTTTGKVVWVSFWGCLTCWIIPHILNWPEDRLSS